jgi:hypothetical protein
LGSGSGQAQYLGLTLIRYHSLVVLDRQWYMLELNHQEKNKQKTWGTVAFFLKIWKIPKFWEISQIFNKYGKIWENWIKTDQGDFLVLRNARDCTPMD